MPIQKPTWGFEVLKSALKRCDKKTGLVTLQDIYKDKDDMVKRVGSEGITPDATIRQNTQMLKDLGLLEFVDYKGLYRIRSQEISQKYLKFLEDASKRMSKGEKMISEILDSVGLEYTREKKYPGLKKKTYLRVDFSFTVNGCEIIVEFDGIQHKKIIEHFGGLKGYLERVENDKLKDKFAENTAKKLIRIETLKSSKARFQILKGIAEVYLCPHEIKTLGNGRRLIIVRNPPISRKSS